MRAFGRKNMDMAEDSQSKAIFQLPGVITESKSNQEEMA